MQDARLQGCKVFEKKMVLDDTPFQNYLYLCKRKHKY